MARARSQMREPNTADAAPRAPSINQQKSFIIENSNILSREIKLTILALVTMEIEAEGVVRETGGAKEVDIDLDAVEAANPEVITHIYNIVLSRREALSHPAGHPEASKPASRSDAGGSA